MNAQVSTRPHLPAVPDGYGTVTPWIIGRDTAALIDFLVAAFGAEEVSRLELEDGTIGHAEVRIGDSMVMMFDARPEWPDTPTFLRLYVEDGDDVMRRAVAAGASVVTELTHLFWGDRVGRVRDPWGNLFWVQERVEEVDPDEIGRRATDPVFTEAMAYVQGADFFGPATPGTR